MSDSSPITFPTPIQLVLEDSDTIPYGAMYLPAVEPVEGIPATCILPTAITSTLDLPALPALSNLLDCGLNFIPTPLVAIPFVPEINLDELVIPCDTFRFDTQYVPLAGQTLAVNNISLGRFHVAVGSTGSLTNAALGVSSKTDSVLPELQVYKVMTATYNTYNIAEGERYVVTTPVDYPTSGVIYVNLAGEETTFYNGQVFKGIAGHPTAERNVDTALITLQKSNRYRIINYERSDPTEGTLLYVDPTKVDGTSFTDVASFVFNRIVIGVDPYKETGGVLKFDPAADTCGGNIYGEINLNLDDLNLGDLNIPCENGFHMDTGYVSKVGESIAVTGDGKTVSANAAVDFTALIPPRITGVNAETGLNHPMPALRVYVPAVGDVEAHWELAIVDTVTGPTGLTLKTPLALGSYAKVGDGVGWHLQRINVEVVAGAVPAGRGGFEYIPDVGTTSCGGMLLGDIALTAADFGTNFPCLNASVDTESKIYSTDRLRVTLDGGNIQQDNDLSGTSKTITLAKNDLCKFSFAPLVSTLNFPDIRIEIYLGGVDGDRIKFARTYEPNGSTTGSRDRVTFTGTLPAITGDDTDPVTGTTCVNCCRWS